MSHDLHDWFSQQESYSMPNFDHMRSENPIPSNEEEEPNLRLINGFFLFAQIALIVLAMNFILSPSKISPSIGQFQETDEALLRIIIGHLFLLASSIIGGCRWLTTLHLKTKPKYFHFEMMIAFASTFIFFFNIGGNRIDISGRHTHTQSDNQKQYSASESFLKIESIVASFRPGQNLADTIDQLTAQGLSHQDDYLYQKSFSLGKHYSNEISNTEYWEESRTIRLMPDVEKTRLEGWQHISYQIKERPLMEDKVYLPNPDICRVIQEHPSKGKYPRQCNEDEAALGLIRPVRCKSKCSPCDAIPDTIEDCI